MFSQHYFQEMEADMREDRFEIKDLEYILEWAIDHDVFLSTQLISNFLGFDSSRMIKLMGRVNDRLACRVLGKYKTVGYVNYDDRSDCFLECYKKMGLKIVPAEDYFQDKNVFNSRSVRRDGYIVTGLKFVDGDTFRNEFSFISELLGNFGVSPERRGEVYFMPSDILVQRFNLDNRPVKIISANSELQIKLLAHFLESNGGEIEITRLYELIYGTEGDSFFDRPNKLYNLISSLNITMEKLLKKIEHSGVNLERMSLSKDKNNKYKLILLNKEDNLNFNMCYLNYHCTGKVS